MDTKRLQNFIQNTTISLLFGALNSRAIARIVKAFERVRDVFPMRLTEGKDEPLVGIRSPRL